MISQPDRLEDIVKVNFQVFEISKFKMTLELNFDDLDQISSKVKTPYYLNTFFNQGSHYA